MSIYTEASNTKCSKDEAFGIIRGLAACYQSGEKLVEIDRTDLAKLYAHFLPKPPAKPKTALEWLARAVAVNDRRHYLKYIYVAEDHVAHATDGCRLHFCVDPAVHGLPAPGFYNTQGEPCEVDATYPDTSKYTDLACRSRESVTIDTRDCERKPLRTDVKNPPFAIKVGPAWVNEKYLKDAIAGQQAGEFRHGESEDVLSASVSFDSCYAVVMPVRGLD